MSKVEKIEGGSNKVVMKELLPVKSTGFSECLLYSGPYRVLKARQAKAPKRQRHPVEEERVAESCQSIYWFISRIEGGGRRAPFERLF